MKRFISIISMLLVAISLTGCDNVYPTDEMEKYLESKYDTEFELIGTINGSPIPFARENIVMAQFKCMDYPDKIVTASYNRREGKTNDNIPILEYYDNINELTDKLATLAGIVDYRIEQRIPDSVIVRTNTYTYEDYLKNYNWKFVAIVTTQDISDSTAETILNYLEDENISLDVRLAQIDSFDSIGEGYTIYNILGSTHIIDSIEIEADAVEHTFGYEWLDF